MLWLLCGSSPFLIWIEVARSCVPAAGTRIEYQEVQSRRENVMLAAGHFGARILARRVLILLDI